MGATPAKQFPQPGSYAMDNENIVAPQDPVPQAPQQQFVSTNSYSQAGAPPAAAAPVNNGRQNGRGRGKFFGDMELDDYGNQPGSKPRQGLPVPIFPPPVKKPHDLGGF